MGREDMSLKMEATTMASGIIIEFVEEDSSIFLTTNFSMKESGTTMNSTDGEFITVKKEKFGKGMKASFRME